MVFVTLRLIRRVQPDLLHAHGYEAALAAGICRLLTGVPVVYSAHNTMADELPSYRFIRPQWLARGLARLLDSFVPKIGTRCLPHSTNIEQFLHRQGLRERTEPVVNFGIDVDWMSAGDGQEVRRRYGLESAPVIVYSGVLDHFQRLELLLEALALVRRQLPAVRLLVVRSLPQEQHLAEFHQRAAALGVADAVIVTELQSLSAVRDCLRAGDVAVVPRPQAPGFPIKLLNYLAAGRPCVLFASSSSNGLLDRVNCLLAEPDTAEALADAVGTLLRDPELAQQLAANGQAFVRAQHGRRAIAEQVCAAYRRTIQPAPAPRGADRPEAITESFSGGAL